MGKFTELISKEGETVQLYSHSFEASRNGTTKLKESKWAASTDITAIVRSQPETLAEMGVGLYEAETILILTTTAIAEHGVIKWQDKYYDIVMVEDMYFRKALDYYKGTCLRRIEFMGS